MYRLTAAEEARRIHERRSDAAIERIAAGLCVIEQVDGEPVRMCVTHGCQASFDHYLSVHPKHSAQGIATND